MLASTYCTYARISRSLVTAEGNFRLPFCRWRFSHTWISQQRGHTTACPARCSTRRHVYTERGDIDSRLHVYVCQRPREPRERERERPGLRPSLGSLIMETILLQCEKGEKGEGLPTAHVTLRRRRRRLACAWLREYLNTCANVRTRIHRRRRES